MLITFSNKEQGVLVKFNPNLYLPTGLIICLGQLRFFIYPCFYKCQPVNRFNNSCKSVYSIYAASTQPK